jgi:hypothetical protein
MTPPDDEVWALTTSTSICGSAIPPAKEVVAATESAAASASFFILTSSYRAPDGVAEVPARTQDCSSYLTLSRLPEEMQRLA